MPVLKTKRENGTIFRMQIKWGYFFITPCIIGLLVFSFGPMIFSLLMSFTEWNMINPPRFIQLQNYSSMIEDPLVAQSLKVTIHYTVLTVPLITVIAFLLAMLLNSGVKGISVFRTIFYIPSIVPIVASSALWMFIYDPMFGLLNTIIKALNLPPQRFIYSTTGVIPGLSIMAVWAAGNTVVIYLAGLQNISRYLYEAAELDGAGTVTKFMHITVPMMTPIIFFNMVLAIIGAMQTFTQAYVMTKGGPANASLFYSLQLYRTAFALQRMGYASAMSWVLFIIIGFLTFLTFRTSDRWVFYENKT